MTGYVHHLDIVIQENHLMQSHAVVVSVLQPPYRFPLHANRPQHLRPILIQDQAPDQPSRAVFLPPPSLTWVCGTSFLLTLARIGVCLLGFLYTTNLNTLPPSSMTALKSKPSLRVVVRTTENEDEGNTHMPIRPSGHGLQKTAESSRLLLIAKADGDGQL